MQLPRLYVECFLYGCAKTRRHEGREEVQTANWMRLVCTAAVSVEYEGKRLCFCVEVCIERASLLIQWDAWSLVSSVLKHWDVRQQKSIWSEVKDLLLDIDRKALSLLDGQKEDCWKYFAGLCVGCHGMLQFSLFKFKHNIFEYWFCAELSFLHCRLGCVSSPACEQATVLALLIQERQCWAGLKTGEFLEFRPGRTLLQTLQPNLHVAWRHYVSIIKRLRIQY